MIAPAVIYILALVGYPLVLAFIYSLSDITIGSSHFSFVGLENIQTLISDFDFKTALYNTISWCSPGAGPMVPLRFW